jgi:hypothetical protein
MAPALRPLLQVLPLETGEINEALCLPGADAVSGGVNSKHWRSLKFFNWSMHHQQGLVKTGGSSSLTGDTGIH